MSICRIKLLAVAVAAVGMFVTQAGAQLITGVTQSGSDADPAFVLDPLIVWTGQTFSHDQENVEGGEWVNFTVPTLDEDVPAFVDRNHQYNGATAGESLASMGLVGAEYVMPANDNKDADVYEMRTTVGSTVDAYVFYDTRSAPRDWLIDDGWTYLNRRIGIDEGATGVGPGENINNVSGIWKKSNVAPGTIVTGTYSNGGNMYALAITEPGVGPGRVEYPDLPLGNFGLIDIGATGGRAEPGALADTGGISQIGAAAHNENGINLDPRSMTSSLGDSFTVSIDNNGTGGLDWRDRGDSPPIDDTQTTGLMMGEDFVKNNLGIVRVTLSGLPEGEFEVTSYHYDADNSQCEAIKVLVDTGDGSGMVDTGVLGDASGGGGGVYGMTLQDLTDSSATFTFNTDGTSDVQILFDGSQAADDEVPLNGLNIRRLDVPDILLGDVNLDGQVNGLDVDPFVGLVTGGTFQSEGDMNGDGVVNGLDVDPFVAAVVGGGAQAVPEPSTVILVLLGLLALAMPRASRRLRR